MFLVVKLATLGEFLSDCLHHKIQRQNLLFYSNCFPRFQQQKPENWKASSALSLLQPGGGGEGSEGQHFQKTTCPTEGDWPKCRPVTDCRLLGYRHPAFAPGLQQLCPQHQHRPPPQQAHPVPGEPQVRLGASHGDV